MCSQKMNTMVSAGLSQPQSIAPSTYFLCLICAAFWVNPSALPPNSLIRPTSVKFSFVEDYNFFHFPGFLIHSFSFQISFVTFVQQLIFNELYAFLFLLEHFKHI